MKNAKDKRHIHHEGVKYTYIQDDREEQIRVYDPKTKQIWFTLHSNHRPHEVKAAIVEELNVKGWFNFMTMKGADLSRWLRPIANGFIDSEVMKWVTAEHDRRKEYMIITSNLCDDLPFVRVYGRYLWHKESNSMSFRIWKITTFGPWDEREIHPSTYQKMFDR